MSLHQLNLNQLRVFECVYRCRNMTLASKQLFLTQSGISQHIKALEEALGVRLFDRIANRIVPTTEGNYLYEHCSRSLQDLDRAVSEIQGHSNKFQGTVTIGMPVEFGNNLILPLVAEFAQKHPFLKYKFRLEYANAINDLLLKGDLDFAFVDDYPMDRGIHREPVYNEVLELCASHDWAQANSVPARPTKEFFEDLSYVDYADNEPVLRMWFAHHLGNRNFHVNVRAYMMDVQGVARMIKDGLGVGVVPGHLLAKLKQEGVNLYIFKGCGQPLTNQISLAYLKDRTQSRPAQALMTSIQEGLILAQKRRNKVLETAV